MIKYKENVTPPHPPIPIIPHGGQRQITLVPLQRRIAILCVGRGGLVRPSGVGVAREPPAARHLDCVSSTQRHCVSATDKSELAGPGTLEYCF